MISIGNDIVALDTINAGRTRTTACYSKILTQPEIALYASTGLSSLPFEYFVWLIWSVKESVYKCAKRNNPHYSFSLKMINITTIQPLGKGRYQSTITFDSTLFYATSTLRPAFIRTQATNIAHPPNIKWGVKNIGSTEYSSQSAAVRQLLLDRLQHLFPNDHLHIEKAPAGFPILIKNGTPMSMPISFSHHHNLVYFAMIISA